MATREQAEMIAQKIIEVHPANFFKVINDTNAGIGLVLRLLHSAEGNSLTAGEISEAMNVSTARVAVLLKKMETRGLIVKGDHPSDARITVAAISEKGKEIANQMRENMLAHIAMVIDKVGMEKMQQFIALSIEVKNAMEDGFPPKPEI